MLPRQPKYTLFPTRRSSDLIWGEIKCSKKFSRYYQQKGNHISKAGWPVLTNFTGEYFTTPVYSLGAALVKKQWLLHSPFDEVDRKSTRLNSSHGYISYAVFC